MPRLKTEYKYIFFSRVSAGSDPEFWTCKNRKSDERLGLVEYYKPWRQFVFGPFEGAVFSHDCLSDISDFLKQLNKTK